MKKILADRQIDYLAHFTRAENIENIFKYGLYPRSKLDFSDFNYIYNDDYRYDGCENAVCTSIEFPNFKMFYTLRCNNPNTDWVVLGIKAEVICDFDCAFCATNAGSEEMYSIPLEEQKGEKAFLKLFEELPNGPTRNELGIGDWYPTNPQAEVLVFDTIPIKYIDCVVFNNSLTLNNYTSFIPKNIKSKVNTELFFGRMDYKHWQKKD